MAKKQFRKELLKEYVNTWGFKIILILSIVFMLYGVSNYGINESYSIALLNFTSVTTLVVCNFLLPLLLTTTMVYKIFNSNYFLSIRLNSKKERLKELLKALLYINTFVFIIIIVIDLIGLNLVCADNLAFTQPYFFYDIPNIIYLLFYIIRFYILLMIISIFNGLLLDKFSSKIVIFLNILFCGILFIQPYIPISEDRNSILSMPLFIGEYFQTISFSTFLMEVLCSTAYVVILLGLIHFIVNVKIKKNDLNSLKYLILNDFSYTVKSQKLLLIVYFIYLVIFSILKIYVIDYGDGFYEVLGLNANTELDFLNMVAFFLNTLVFILLGTNLFIKDLSKNKSNIFLRIKSLKWVLMKFCSMIIQFAVILSIGYLIVCLLFIFLGEVPQNIINVYFTNLVVLIIIECLTLLFIYGKILIKIIISVLTISIIYLNLACIIDLSKWLVWLSLLMIISLTGIIVFFRKNIYKLFESEVLK